MQLAWGGHKRRARVGAGYRPMESDELILSQRSLSGPGTNLLFIVGALLVLGWAFRLFRFVLKIYDLNVAIKGGNVSHPIPFMHAFIRAAALWYNKFDFLWGTFFA